MPRFDFSQLDSLGLIHCYDRLFGTSRVEVFAYEDFRRDPGSFLDRYAMRLGLEGAGSQAARARVNASYRRGLLPVARLFNRFTARGVADKRVWVHVPHWYRARKRLLARLDQLPLFGTPLPPEELLGSDIAAWIRTRFAPMNRRLAQRMDLDLGALGYAMDAQPVPDPVLPRWRAALRY